MELFSTNFRTNRRGGIKDYEKEPQCYPFSCCPHDDRRLCGLRIDTATVSTGEVVDDSVITTKIKSEIAADDLLKGFQVSVETRKGIVELSGFVDSQKAKDKAGEILAVSAGSSGSRMLSL